MTEDYSGTGQFVTHGRWRGRKRYELEDRGYETSCWIWLGLINDKTGYPNNSVHKHFYELVHEKVPVGFDVHHMCEVKSCVNPAHMTPLLSNVHRRDAILAWHASLTPEQREARSAKLREWHASFTPAQRIAHNQAVWFGRRRAKAMREATKKI